MNKITFDGLAGLAFAGGLTVWSTINWYKDRGSRNEKRARRVAEEQGSNEALAEQLA